MLLFLYRILTNLFYPLLIILIFLRKLRGKEDKIRFKEKIFYSYFNVKKEKDAKLIWFHAASVGEVQSIFPIIEKLNSNKKNLQFLITTITFSSGKLVREEFSNFENVTHRYLPLDINFLVKKFLNLWRPDVVLFVDSEIWPNLILNVKKSNIPLGIINGRITLRTFKKWMLIPKTAKSIFRSFNLILASSFESNEYLEKLGAKNIFNIGNIKFSKNINLEKIHNKNKNILESKKFWCAASTHEEEDEFCIETHINLKKKLTNILTIIIPRHIDRSEKIKKICLNHNLRTQIINIEDSVEKSTEILIINSFGVLPNYFRYAKSVFMGKSMIESLKLEGGQNPILAAKLGCKIYHGPYIYNFKEVYSFLQKNNISEEILNASQLSDKLIKDLNEEKKNFLSSKEMIDSIGDKILKDTTNKINILLNNEYE